MDIPHMWRCVCVYIFIYMYIYFYICHNIIKSKTHAHFPCLIKAMFAIVFAVFLKRDCAIALEFPPDKSGATAAD